MSSKLNESNGDIHIIPTNDLHEHTMSADCECKPNVMVEGAVLIYVHNSFDDREFFEQLEIWFNLEEDDK